jgi:hypothetical protein
MGRSQEFSDALETARANVQSRLSYHQHDLDPAHVEMIAQRHAEQLHGARKLEKWKKEMGLAPA